MTESIDWNDGDDEPQQPRSGLWQRLRRTRSGSVGTDATCRPVSVLGTDGEPVHTRVLGDAPMSDEAQQAFGDVVRAAQRRHLAELRAERQAADDDVRAVKALLDANDMAVSPSLFASAWENLATRFAGRIADLNARDAKARARTPIQGSGYTPLQLLGVVDDRDAKAGEGQ